MGSLPALQQFMRPVKKIFLKHLEKNVIVKFNHYILKVPEIHIIEQIFLSCLALSYAQKHHCHRKKSKPHSLS